MLRPIGSADRFEPEDASILLIGQEVDLTIWTLDDLPYAFSKRDALLADDTGRIERKADQSTRT